MTRPARRHGAPAHAVRRLPPSGACWWSTTTATPPTAWPNCCAPGCRRSTVAYSGEEALQRCVESCRIDVAVLDIGMPGMDGCELARASAARDRTARSCTLIALTGWGQKADRELVVAAAGFDHHLLKPVDATELIALL